MWQGLQIKQVDNRLIRPPYRDMIQSISLTRRRRLLGVSRTIFGIADISLHTSISITILGATAILLCYFEVKMVHELFAHAFFRSTKQVHLIAHMCDVVPNIRIVPKQIGRNLVEELTRQIIKHLHIARLLACVQKGCTPTWIIVFC